MKVVNVSAVKKQHISAPLFTGPVVRQSPVVDNEGSDLSIDYVHFPKGIRNKFHTHSNDQVLIVTKGKGIVANKTEQQTIKVGDVAWIPAGETHWHGATDDSEFTHVSVTRSHSKLAQIEK
ncbi:MAG TPA: cupin domain-containing protein [Patescibacteria group bacterium]|nr:cupin domain-containing protein [Patescibacteria group bacterium]